MGYNTLMLYTEDMYEIEDEPYFGYMRGRFTAADWKEMDDYAALMGIELVPCIQTLAHLEAILRWPAYGGLKDCDNILIVGDDQVYALIDKMLAAMSKNLRSRRINIGMDEAGMLGRGQYLRRNGYRPSHEIMLEHLNRVVELCRKYDYQPIMWSDMFFSMSSPVEAYYDKNTVIPEEVIKLVPPEVTLAYWDYYHLDPTMYDHMIDQHHRFRNPMLFAGGAWKWSGLTPVNHFGQKVAKVALERLRGKGRRSGHRHRLGRQRRRMLRFRRAAHAADLRGGLLVRRSQRRASGPPPENLRRCRSGRLPGSGSAQLSPEPQRQ